MRLALEAAVAVVDTLTDADYATVIGFQSFATSMSTSLMRADRSTRQSMRNWINANLRASGGTNFVAAFDKVVQVLQASTALQKPDRD